MTNPEEVAQTIFNLARAARIKGRIELRSFDDADDVCYYLRSEGYDATTRPTTAGRTAVIVR